MEKDEFIKKAVKLGYSQEMIDEIIKKKQEDIAKGIPIDWSKSLVMEKDEFIKEAVKLGYSQEMIDEIIKENEEDIAMGIPIDWSKSLVEVLITD